MPYKDYEDRLASQRRSYRRNAEKVKAATKRRKYVDYAGWCRNCGGPTTGESNVRREWCGKPECRSVRMQLRHLGFFDREQNEKWAHDTVTVRYQGRYRVYCGCGWAGDWHEAAFNAYQQQAQHTGLKEHSNLRPNAR